MKLYTKYDYFLGDTGEVQEALERKTKADKVAEKNAAWRKAKRAENMKADK